MHLWMIFKNFTSRRFNFNWHRVRCQFGSWERPTAVNALVNLLILGPFHAPIAALSLKFINHPLLSFYFTLLCTPKEMTFLVSCIITPISVRAPLPPRRLAKDEGIEGLPANVCLFGCFFYLSSLPCPPVFHLFNNIDFSPGALTTTTTTLSLHAIFNNNNNVSE